MHCNLAKRAPATTWDRGTRYALPAGMETSTPCLKCGAAATLRTRGTDEPTCAAHSLDSGEPDNCDPNLEER